VIADSLEHFGDSLATLCFRVKPISIGAEINYGASRFNWCGNQLRCVPFKSTPTEARRAVYLLGRLICKNTPWAQAMYEDGRRRGQRAAAIYRKIARSMLRILHAVLRDQSEYDPQRYLKTLQQKGVPWAPSLPPA
jgi:hypothetical protein